MLRRRSIRLRIIVLVLVPVVALVGLYAVALSLTLSSFLALKAAADIRNQVTNPITNVQLQLSMERALALQYLANPTHPKLIRLLSQEPKTDAAVNAYLNAATRTNPNAGAAERHASQRWSGQLATLHALRAAVVSIGLSRASAAVSYSTLIAGADFVLTQAVLPVLSTQALIQASDILTLEESLQAVAEERDLFAADLAARNYPPPDSTLVNQLAIQHWELWNQGIASLNGQYLDFFTADIPAGLAAHLTDLETPISAGQHRALRVSLREWTSVNDAYAAGFRKALRSSSNALRTAGQAEARSELLRLIAIGGLGLMAIIGALAVALVLGSALLQQLDELRLSALDLASVRLPAVLARLRSGQEIDVAAETPQLDPSDNEVGQLGRAFNIAAQAAVTAAVDEADIRRGVNDVFRNLARRNQSLLTRQLELLDAMERRVHDPEELADLFRVDHLTTRMRRHAEGLLIVAGGTSGRVWREPVPIVDVMRAAVAEIEDYTRIRVTSRSSSSVAGHAVADIIHMLAELVENATTFSPANTPVRIESDNVAKGLIVEIEDRGLGMTEKQIGEINSKLNDPPQLDLSGSEQLGLFIAGQLARRHDVKITMRGSAYGGITAVVLMPSALVIDPGYDEPLTIVGLRELGGRPVPQLSAAELVDDDTASSVELAAAPDPVSAAGYILDLEVGTGSVTTTAAQVDTAEGAGLAGTGPRVRYTEPVTGELVSADLADDAVSTDADAEPAALKGAGAWLTEAESATVSPTTVSSTIVSSATVSPTTVSSTTGQEQPWGEPALAAATPPAVTSPPPMLVLGQQADAASRPATASEPVSPAPDPATSPSRAGADATLLSPADDWAAILNSTTRSSSATPQAPAAPAPPPTESTRPAMDFGRIARPPEPPDAAGAPRHVGWPARADDQQAGRGSVGWPDLPAASSGWLNLGVSGQGAETTGSFDRAAELPRRQAHPQPDQAPSPRTGASRADGQGNGSYGAQGDGSAPDQGLLPRRQPRTASLSFGQDLADTDSFGPVPSEPSPADLDGLPVRVRQASLAPQLRNQASTPRAPLVPQAEHYVAAPEMPAERAVTAEPSPEAARSFMSALQRGWERGRSAAEHLTEEPDDEQS